MHSWDLNFSSYTQPPNIYNILPIYYITYDTIFVTNAMINILKYIGYDFDNCYD